MSKKDKPEYRIPNDEDVQKAIYSAVHKMSVVESQHKFRELVQKELFTIDPGFRISPKRLRMLALHSGYIKVEIHTREEDRISKKLKSCPVCGSKLDKLKNMTIYGGKVTLGYTCVKCSYITGRIYRRPVRYIFTRQKVGKIPGGMKLDNGLFAL
jgi:hypothetical protein